MSNSEYVVGQLCVIVGPNEPGNYLLGRDCTIVKGLHYRTDLGGDRYEIEIEGEADVWTAEHVYLKPKQPPQQDDEQEAFKEFMNNVLKPVSLPEEELT